MTRRSTYRLGVLSAVLLAVLIAVPRAAPRGPEVQAFPADLQELLSGIDLVPTREELNTISVTGDDLIAIARDTEQDPGLRIRAYRALALYPGANTEKALSDAIDEHGSVADGVETIYVRAAMDSLAVVAGVQGVAHITPMLGHPSRDVRAGAAYALSVCGDPDVIPALRDMVNDPDEVAQVKTACIEAIRTLLELQ